MRVEVRVAGPDDAETLFAIQKAASLAAFAHIFPPEEHDFPDDEVRRVRVEGLAEPGAEVLLAERDGEAVGYVQTAPGWLASLFVRPESQGTGVGSLLHDRAIARMHELGCEACRLWVLEQNEPARRFYERRGWRPDGETRVTPFPPHPTSLRYTLPLRS